KGGAGTFGFTILQETTHLMENLLDEARRGEMQLNTDIINLFLPRNPAIFAKQTGFILYISHPAGILAPSFKSTRIQHEIICKS
ncbi:Hpt domain-containing protein, partial [Salmonella enterica subsp. enterica serovar Lubbock]|nr:Hpt domain-containing protein [Salmonella enterica subsp. enterica serovar Lubbock]